MRTWISIAAIWHFFFGLLVSFQAAIAAEDSAGRKPNIVFLLIDDMGWPDVACYGHKFHETPVIDRLVAQGRRRGRDPRAS